MRLRSFGSMKTPNAFDHLPATLTGDESSVDHYDPDYWARVISDSMRRTVEGIIETGNRFKKAKDNLHHGQFTAMVEQKLNMTVRMAERYMAAAKHPILSNPTHASLLPAAVDTLASMASIPDNVLQQKLADGTITPKLRRKDIARLKGTEDKRRKGLALPGGDDQREGSRNRTSEGTTRRCGKRGLAVRPQARQHQANRRHHRANGERTQSQRHRGRYLRALQEIQTQAGRLAPAQGENVSSHLGGVPQAP
jgi:hypothetical protein